MLHKANDLIGLQLHATDGEIGKCHDLLFDDAHWTIRYMDARAGNWLTGKRVLISPVSLQDPDWDNHQFPVNLTRDQIAQSPAIAEDQPISKQYETHMFRHYGYGYYWMGEQPWGAGIYPAELQLVQPDPEYNEREGGDEHLRSINEVSGYDVYIDADKVGTVDGFLLESGTWILRYLVVDTGKWLFHNSVIVPVTWIRDISWAENTVALTMQHSQLKDAPPYNDQSPVTREYEDQYFRHFGQPPYWR